MRIPSGGMKPGAHRPALMAALLAAALSVSRPSAQAQQTITQTESPVIITDCRGGIASIELVEVAAYNVTLRNTRDISADEIRLTVRTRRNKLLNFDLKGAFDPRNDVKRRVGRSVGLGFYSYSSANNQCSIDWVHFADGSSWSKS